METEGLGPQALVTQRSRAVTGWLIDDLLLH